mgnify:CR=1 FL=1
MGVELNSSTVVEYEYDSASRLVQRVEGGTTTNYTWDGWDLIKEVKSGTVNETTNYLVPSGELLAFERGGDFFYLHGDGLSSTQLVTDENGAQVGRFIYGAWGEELHASESFPGILENRFVGGLGCRKDAATGLIYMRHRWYDPALQRFISRDPLVSRHQSSYRPPAPGLTISRAMRPVRRVGSQTKAKVPIPTMRAPKRPRFASYHVLENLFAYASSKPTKSVDPSGEIGPGPDALVIFDLAYPGGALSWASFECDLGGTRKWACDIWFKACKSYCLFPDDVYGAPLSLSGPQYAECEYNCGDGMIDCNNGIWPWGQTLVRIAK